MKKDLLGESVSLLSVNDTLGKKEVKLGENTSKRIRFMDALKGEIVQGYIYKDLKLFVTTHQVTTPGNTLSLCLCFFFPHMLLF